MGPGREDFHKKSSIGPGLLVLWPQGEGYEIDRAVLRIGMVFAQKGHQTCPNLSIFFDAKKRQLTSVSEFLRGRVDFFVSVCTALR